MLFLAGFALVNLRGMQDDAARPPDTAVLAARDWRLEALDGKRVDSDAPPVLRFQADGSLGGFAGCNTFSGAYALDGDRIRIGEIAVTRRACDDDDGSLENAFLDALGDAATVRRLGPRIALLDAGGESRLRFSAVEYANGER